MTLDRLKTLAIRQPWAWAVCIGAKDIENRTWTTEYRGPLVIQASAAKQEVNAIAKGSKGKLKTDEMTFGALVGVAELVDVVPLCESLEDNPWATGPYCWVFANARQLDEAIPYKGALHLFDLPDGISDNIRKQLSRPPIGRPKFAEGWLTAMASDPFEMQATRCMSYRDIKDCGGIIRTATAMIRIQPDSSDAYRLRGAGHFFGGDPVAGISDLQEAIRLDHSDANAHYLLAWAYKETGDPSRSDSHWNTAKQLDPDVPELE